MSARAAREREAAPELSSGRDGAAREAERARLLREASSVRRPRGDAAAETASGVFWEGAPSGRGRPRCWGGLWLSVTCSEFAGWRAAARWWWVRRPGAGARRVNVFLCEDFPRALTLAR